MRFRCSVSGVGRGLSRRLSRGSCQGSATSVAGSRDAGRDRAELRAYRSSHGQASSATLPHAVKVAPRSAPPVVTVFGSYRDSHLEGEMARKRRRAFQSIVTMVERIARRQRRHRPTEHSRRRETVPRGYRRPRTFTSRRFSAWEDTREKERRKENGRRRSRKSPGDRGANRATSSDRRCVSSEPATTRRRTGSPHPACPARPRSDRR
jgi:hypothetical protein